MTVGWCDNKIQTTFSSTVPLSLDPAASVQKQACSGGHFDPIFSVVKASNIICTRLLSV